MPLNPVIALIAGEASGDQLGAALIRELKAIYPAARFVGIGGQNMKDEGFEAWWNCEELAVMGLAEVLSHLPRLLKLRKAVRKKLLALKPDIFIGIDAPDFNLAIEKTLRNAGITTVHYVSPSVWAWRQGRVKGIGKAADLVLCLFPFEPAIYKEFGVSAEFTGHPMADEIPLENDKKSARSDLGLDPARPCIAILPGSRRAEADQLSKHFLDAAKQLLERDPVTQFIAPMANKKVRAIFEASLTQHSGVECTLFDGKARQVMAAADLVLCASGTAALEVLLINRPMVVVGRVSVITEAVVRLFRLFKGRFFSLPNVLADELLVPEFSQRAVTGQNIAFEAIALLENPSKMESVSLRFSEIHKTLSIGAAACAATSIRTLLEKES